MASHKCPKCFRGERQVKDGRTPSGSQRYRCKLCGCRYTPNPKEHGYDEDVRFQALQLYLEGKKLREIARQLDVNHQSIANWINAYATYLPPSIAEKARLEGLYLL